MRARRLAARCHPSSPCFRPNHSQWAGRASASTMNGGLPLPRSTRRATSSLPPTKSASLSASPCTATSDSALCLSKPLGARRCPSDSPRLAGGPWSGRLWRSSGSLHNPTLICAARKESTLEKKSPPASSRGHGRVPARERWRWRILVGDAKWVLGSTSSLARNLEGCGYCTSPPVAATVGSTPSERGLQPAPRNLAALVAGLRIRASQGCYPL